MILLTQTFVLPAIKQIEYLEKKLVFHDSTNVAPQMSPIKTYNAAQTVVYVILLMEFV